MPARLLTCFLLLMLFAGALSCGEAPSAATALDPQEVLSEAQIDAAQGRYEAALEKHVWFHENALVLNPYLAGVRLSFALSDWEQLGRVYPPALEALQRLRDGLEARALKGEDLQGAMADLVAMNRTLAEEPRTVQAFRALHTLNPGAAASAFVFVKAALIDAQDYGLYATYVDAEADFKQAKQLYKQHRALALAKGVDMDANFAVFAERHFRATIATLVAILAIAGEHDVSRAIATQAGAVIDDVGFAAQLEAALAGNVPEPWL